MAKRFGKLIGADPWLIHPLYEKCGEVDFSKPAGRDCVAANADALFTKIRRKYKEYGITEKPFVVVKPDNGGVSGGDNTSGRQGMGILTLRDAKDLAALNAVQHPAGNVILQEGVITNERMNAAVAEPVVYMMDRYVVGGFYRIHSDRGVDEVLSAPGSSYVPLAFAESTHLPQPGSKPGASAPNRFYMYGVVARLAMLAASYELEATDPEAQDFD